MKPIKSVLAVVAAVGMLGSAQADTLIVNYGYMGPSYDVTVGLIAPVLVPPSLTASPFLVVDTTLANSFAAFCLEPLQELSTLAVTTGDSTYSAAAFNTAAVVQLYNDYYAGALATPTQAAAFQFALWELVSDTGANMTSGSFAIAADPVTTLAQQMLNGTAVKTPGLYNLVQWNSVGSQDMLQAVPVPEAGTLALMLVGLFGVIGAARRKA